MVGALAESDERDVGTFSRSCRPDVLDIDLASDHLMPECGDDRREQRQAIPSLVRDQNAQMVCFSITHSFTPVHRTIPRSGHAKT